MIVIPESDFVKCSFDPGFLTKSACNQDIADVYFARTDELGQLYPGLRNYLSEDERVRAHKFIHEKDRFTYVLCHAVVRLIISVRLRCNPSDISFLSGPYNKPGLPGDPFYFNITHTAEAFAIVISKSCEAGIDMESVNRKMNFAAIVNSFFSKREKELIFQSESGAPERFYLLWTRKESLLKALGTGISDYLPGIEVSEKENIIKRDSFDNLISSSDFCDHFIYSVKYMNYFLSVAVPCKTEINLHHLTAGDIYSFSE